MITVGSIIVTSHGLARVVAVSSARDQSTTLQERDVQAVPLSNSFSSSLVDSESNESGGASESAAAAFTKAYLMSIEPGTESDPLARARAEAQASLHAYTAAEHHSKGEDGEDQVIDVRT